MMKRKVKGDTLVLFLGILTVVTMTLLSFMTFLPSPNEESSHGIDNPMAHIHFAGRKAEIQLHTHQAVEKLLKKREQKRKQHSQQQGGQRYYMVFSTSCSPFQHWQALAFFHFALKVQQPGNVTRLVSGCSPEDLEALQKYHEERIAPLSPSFHMHVTPDFDVGSGNQKYWNKPHGLLNYLEKKLGFPENAEDHKDAIIIIVDPDMMLLRPITHDFTGFRTEWGGGVKRTDKVVHGMPIAQKYGYGSEWLTSLKGNLSYVVGPDSPALKVTVKEANDFYPAGPPYLATGSDMFSIATHWVKFLPRIHELFPQFMAEMHAYSVAAAHLELPHQLAEGFMVSDVSGVPGVVANEGFAFLDNTTRADACVPNKIPMNQLPLVLHYCQRYSLGRWFFSKYKLREDFFTCSSPLLREPPPNLGEIYDWNIFPNEIEKLDMSTAKRKQSIVLNGWMLCTIMYSLNEIATNVKKVNCGADANYSKIEIFHDADKFQAMLDDPSNPFPKNNTRRLV